MSSSIDIIEYDRRIVSPLYDVMMDALAGLADATHHHWFAREVRDRRLLGYLEYAPDITLVQAMRGLFYALSHSGSREGLCQLIHGIFGVQSVIIIDEEANTLSIEVINAMVSTDYVIASHKSDPMVHASKGYAIAGGSLSSVLGNDPAYFFRDFLPAGVVITSFHIRL